MNLINALLPINKKKVLIVKEPYLFTMIAERDRDPIFTMGRQTPTCFKSCNRTIKGEISVQKEIADEFINSVNSLKAFAVKHHDSVVLIENSTISLCGNESSHLEFTYTAETIKHYKTKNEISFSLENNLFMIGENINE